MTPKKEQPTTETTPAKKKATKPRSKAAKKPSSAPTRPDALSGKRYTHRKRAEWGIGTVIDGADNALVIAWSDGVERRTARTYMDHLVEVP